MIRRPSLAPLLAGAFLLVMLIHAVETAKFVVGWRAYRAAVQALATGDAADPDLGDPAFVSAQRIGADLNRLSWNSTTPYLSVLVAAGFSPRRLVVDPIANYFWLSCTTATRSEAADVPIPAEARAKIRRLACLHR